MDKLLQKKLEIKRLVKALAILRNESKKSGPGNLLKPFFCLVKAQKLSQKIELKIDFLLILNKGCNILPEVIEMEKLVDRMAKLTERAEIETDPAILKFLHESLDRRFNILVYYLTTFSLEQKLITKL